MTFRDNQIYDLLKNRNFGIKSIGMTTNFIHLKKIKTSVWIK